MSEHQYSRAGDTKNAGAGDAKKNVTHVHHARITEHPIEPLLGNCDEADVNDVSEEQDDEQSRPVSRSLRQKGNSQTQKTVQAKFFQHSSM